MKSEFPKSFSQDDLFLEHKFYFKDFLQDSKLPIGKMLLEQKSQCLVFFAEVFFVAPE